jgi:steroid 5-alpha reductase family enzyme
LAFYIGRRFLSHTTEDARYATWREEWSKKGAWYTGIRSLFQVFILQGMLMFGVMLPVMIFNFSKIQILTPFFIIGILVWSIGFFFEVVGDWQLKNFLQSRSGGIMNKGLWRYTRHPNYFGEAVLWWGIWLIAFGEYFWISIVGPLTIFFLLRFVSGVPMAEEGYRKDEEFQEYKKKTPAMFPNFLIK